MLWLGLTGGIGAGKSAVTDVLRELGSAVIDADVLAREVVEPGTPGLAAVVEAFGEAVLRPDGTLDRPALGQRVFGDDDARRRLNGILHPLIGERTGALAAAAEASRAPLLVHDVPLLVENGLAAMYHLVVVVQAPLEARLERLTGRRGMTAEDARARIAAQATDEQRSARADVLLHNDAGLADLRREVELLWRSRLLPYAENVAARRPAEPGDLPLTAPHDGWAAAGQRLVDRLRFLAGARAATVEPLGDAESGLTGPVAVRVEAATPQDVPAIGEALTPAGFPPAGDEAEGGARWHRSADPGRPAEVHVGAAGPDAA